MEWKRSLRNVLLAGALSCVPVLELGESNALPSERREVGVNLTQFVPDTLDERDKASLQKLHDQGYNVISLNPLYHQKTIYSSRIDSTTDMDIESIVKEAHDAHLEVILKPIVNSKDCAPRDSFFTNYPDSWFSDYEQIVMSNAAIAIRHKIKGICIGTELDRMLLVYPDRFDSIAHKIRAAGFRGDLSYSIAFTSLRDLRKIDRLNGIWIDVTGLSFYVPMLKQDSKNEAQRQRAAFESYVYLEKAATRSKRPVIISELGYRSVKHSNRRPFDWKMMSRSDFWTQKVAYENFLSALSIAERNRLNIKGVYFWISDRAKFSWDIDSASHSGYSYFGKPAQKVVDEYIHRRF